MEAPLAFSMGRRCEAARCQLGGTFREGLRTPWDLSAGLSVGQGASWGRVFALLGLNHHLREVGGSTGPGGLWGSPLARDERVTQWREGATWTPASPRAPLQGTLGIKAFRIQPPLIQAGSESLGPPTAAPRASSSRRRSSSAGTKTCFQGVACQLCPAEPREAA